MLYNYSRTVFLIKYTVVVVVVRGVNGYLGPGYRLESYSMVRVLFHGQ